MLPAFNINRWYSIYFLSFMFVGLYFLQNVLLATIFENYKNRCEEKSKMKADTREENLKLLFEQYDDDKNGSLDVEEAKLFWVVLLDLDMESERDQLKFDYIIELTANKETGLAHKTDILRLTTRVDFLEYIEVKETDSHDKSQIKRTTSLSKS